VLGTGLGHLIPLVVYIGFWVIILASLMGKPLYGLYFAMPLIPYRTLRDKLQVYPLGAEILTILLFAIIIGALLHGKRLPKSKLYLTWLIFAVYLYLSMWLGFGLGNAPAPVWLSDHNFSTWKDYIVLPLLFVAAGLVIEDRKAIRRVVMILAFSLLIVDRSSLLESFTHSWAVYVDNKRSGGPLEYGANQLAAFLAQFAMFFWGFGRIIPRKKVKLICYGLTALTIFATMYTFSRGAYLALLVGMTVLGFLKDRKLLLILPIFLLTWKTVVPAPVTNRVEMTETADGQLEASAEERVRLWENAKQSFYANPLLGEGYATFQFGEHFADLKDTHNWYVLVLVETGAIGGLIALVLLFEMITDSYRLFRHARDPLYKAIGLGTLLCVCTCLIANCFGDRWTYIEINGLLWILLGTVARANQLVNAQQAEEREVITVPLRFSPSLESR
jgi:O-antigen ligase